jgi:hypothetical protein
MAAMLCLPILDDTASDADLMLHALGRAVFDVHDGAARLDRLRGEKLPTLKQTQEDRR